ncbi:MAG TPA: TM2 domain-containing protein [Bryobacterales bacterium]|nr:TM2 domain-containing protein [Bryobacterales bacterium]
MASAAQPSTVYCQKCGTPMTPEDRFCRKCGCDSTVPLWTAAPAAPVNTSDRKRGAALLLCFFLGIFGVHRFYVGKTGTGFIWLFTLGLLTFGVLYDLILIALGEFRDATGRKIVEW